MHNYRPGPELQTLMATSDVLSMHQQQPKTLQSRSKRLKSSQEQASFSQEQAQIKPKPSQIKAKPAKIKSRTAQISKYQANSDRHHQLADLDEHTIFAGHFHTIADRKLKRAAVLPSPEGLQ